MRNFVCLLAKREISSSDSNSDASELSYVVAEALKVTYLTFSSFRFFSLLIRSMASFIAVFLDSQVLGRDLRIFLTSSQLVYVLPRGAWLFIIILSLSYIFVTNSSNFVSNASYYCSRMFAFVSLTWLIHLSIDISLFQISFTKVHAQTRLYSTWGKVQCRKLTDSAFGLMISHSSSERRFE